MKETILNGVAEMFLKYGIRSVSMDDIAHQLGISKKTIYQYFEDKNDLVNQITTNILEARFKEYDDKSKEASNAIEELNSISRLIRKHFGEINPAVMFDLQKFHPEAWNLMHVHEHDVVCSSVVDNLKRGIKEGFYRSEIDVNVLARMRVELVHMAFDDNKFPKKEFDLKEVQMQIFDHFVHGLLTESGLELYKKYQKQNDE
ncbi:MAG: TetR/AcrR family transcriptional regulator [Bacteroidota bacterium]